MIKLDAFHPKFIGLAMSFKILGSTASRPIFLQLIALPINMGSTDPILVQTWVIPALQVWSSIGEVQGHVLGSKVIQRSICVELPRNAL